MDRRNLLEARQGNNGNAQSQPQERDEEESTDKVSDNKDDATAEGKLQKIKDLLDKGLISQEEYDKKREEIISSL